MLHVLIGSKHEDYLALLDASERREAISWVVPKSATVGDTVVTFDRGNGFVAHARIADLPAKSLFGKRIVYRSNITEVLLLPCPVPLQHVAHQLPDWAWTTYPRTYTTIDPALSARLWLALGDYQTDLADVGISGELENETFLESRARHAQAIRYERNPQARAACIEHYGPHCSVCSFNFEAFYGPAFSGFIFVHHLELVSTKATPHAVDPVRDLRPVCGNCHAAIHRRTPPYSIEELRRLLDENWPEQKDDEDSHEQEDGDSGGEDG